MSSLDSGPGVPAPMVLTNIAGCLSEVRSNQDRPVGVRLQACVTLVDPERNLMVLQDDSAAMAVYMPRSGVTVKPGQRVEVEGNGIFPSLRALPTYPDEPAERNILESFEMPSNRGTYFLTRIRGFVHPPVTGEYTFWIAADDAGELYLSSNASPEGKRKIAEVKIGSATLSREWDRQPTQQSQPVTLQAGEAYYVEALQVQSYGSENLSVAWSGPGMERALIAGRYLSRWVEPARVGARFLGDPESDNGLIEECWTNFFVRDFEALRTHNAGDSVVRIQGLKLSVTGEAGLPVPQLFGTDKGLTGSPNLGWVEVEGEVDFVGGTEAGSQLELERSTAGLGVRILSLNGLPIEQLRHSRVRIRGVLEHAYGAAGEVTGDVLWVPDGRQLSLLASPEGQPKSADRVSICEIEPIDPQMNWGRWVSVRGRITGESSNGLVVVEGADNYQAFGSEDGTDWLPLGKPVEIGMNSPILGGLALASRSDTNFMTATFNHFQGLGTNWYDVQIGKHGQSGTFSEHDGSLVLRGSGRRIGTTSDENYYLYQSLAEPTEIQAELADTVQADSRAPAGLMFRESMDGRAPYVAVLYTPTSGAVFQYRRTTGGQTTGFEARPDGRRFRWMKLTKRKSSLLVQGGVGPELGTNQPVDITGMITWQNGTPILTEAVFQAAPKSVPTAQPADNQPRQGISIADFVARSLLPPEPYLFRAMDVAKLSGIVTFCGEVLGQHIIFIQDGEGGGIQLGWSDPNVNPGFAVGQLVDISGSSVVRKFPVVFVPTSLRVRGWGTLPEPVSYSPELAQSGAGQARWVEVAGMVRSEETNGSLNLMTKFGPLPVWLGSRRGVNGGEYVDALVRVRGVLSLDEAHTARLLVPSAEFVEVEEKAPADPYTIPGFSIAQLVGLDIKPEVLRRMKTSGVVTCTLPGGIYMQDDTGGVYVQTAEPSRVRPGERVEVVGYPEKHATALILAEATVRGMGAGNPPEPIRITTDDLIKKNHAGMLIGLEATLLEERDTPEAQVLTLQMGPKIFEAARIADGAGRLPQIPPGSRVGITGVCQFDQGVTFFGMSESEAARSVTALKIWLPAPAGLVLLERPPWWTLKRMAWLGAVCAGGFMGALLWVRLLRRRVALRTLELEAAMKRLEQETRTSAVLAERDRLAGEIHDSLEQGLTAIMLQLDAANREADQSPEAGRFLRMARTMAEYSRAEVQHAVWDMQSPLLENADLGTALKHVASQIGSGTPEVRVEIAGTSHPLPSRHEHHLLRIAQEAITNAFKHSRARSIVVRLDYSAADLKLTITDDGGGFVPSAVKPLGQSGHFGLQGIQARAKKIGAEIDIASGTGTGTVIRVHLKLNGESGGAATGGEEPA